MDSCRENRYRKMYSGGSLMQANTEAILRVLDTTDPSKVLSESIIPAGKIHVMTCATSAECKLAQVCDQGNCVEQPCATQAECPDGSTCVGGSCAINCTTSADCPAGPCLNGICEGGGAPREGLTLEGPTPTPSTPIPSKEGWEYAAGCACRCLPEN